MGWSCGYDIKWERDIGYGVPAICDHPGCGEEIDRGLSYVCGQRPYGGDHGCGLYFCGVHLHSIEVPWDRDEGGWFCERCSESIENHTVDAYGDIEPAPVEFFDPTPDVAEWIKWKLTDDSWADWREANPTEVAALVESLGNQP